ncbi:hypothetical protein OSB04_013408 [Centaurea solstitialis]|uniref:Uncharacterized protein n=1 Tax=Centaurea solstitialis TaxID=347529 RepID=A0AA38TD87_9ASTR|nr:hypothetical protein OSB04_013408 [Centaurea solstitialis]
MVKPYQFLIQVNHLNLPFVSVWFGLDPALGDQFCYPLRVCSLGSPTSGKGKIFKGMMTFEDVYYVEQLKYNLLSVSQVCDKKHSILFNDEECMIVSPEFKIVDENMILLRAPRKDNVYCLDLEDVSSKSSLNCLLSKTSLSESSLWHRTVGLCIHNKPYKSNNIL